MSPLQFLPALSVITVEDSAAPIVGFIVVMAALACIWILLEIQGRVFQRLDRNGQAGKEMEMPQQGDLHGGISPEMVAVLSAAVHASLDAPARIVSIRRGGDSAWSGEGRRSIYSSHRIR
jgi:hypothetical protein